MVLKEQFPIGLIKLAYNVSFVNEDFPVIKTKIKFG